ncbi:hypothetical protein BJ684DRAFT_15634 [Piptocephalis cylindrospora]|uniref:Uncharacterized protein n=1 Tax=Piptocephalis cylindrospora TaxID=1907219 RepID=A0A4P9Y4W0_9FUNG|nr:hypothetical protein BJ684DRAFT_15634 [Piptocephalis cylindrospora]|eukprot:RKP14016.1 hypothetical protein BJ684DRAFT_15634 [Piptocephalis cylindrospora]
MPELPSNDQQGQAQTLAKGARKRCRALQCSKWRVVRMMGWSSGLWVPKTLEALSNAVLHTLPSRILFLLGFSPLHTLLLTLSGYVGISYHFWKQYPVLFLHLVATLPPLLRQAIGKQDPSVSNEKGSNGWESYWAIYALGTTVSLTKGQRMPGRTRRTAYWAYMAFLLWAQNHQGRDGLEEGESTVQVEEEEVVEETILYEMTIQDDPCSSPWTSPVCQDDSHEMQGKSSMMNAHAHSPGEEVGPPDLSPTPPLGLEGLNQDILAKRLEPMFEWKERYQDGMIYRVWVKRPMMDAIKPISPELYPLNARLGIASNSHVPSLPRPSYAT